MGHSGALAAAFLLAGQVLMAQTPTNDTPPASSNAPSNPWSLSLATYGYILPHGTSYVSPTFSADHAWLHLEARYNYESLQTGSLWAGYNLSVGHKLVLEATPMIGGVFGNTTGISPGCDISLSYKHITLYSASEYVFDSKNRNGNFFYTWTELTYSPTDWFRAGLVTQRTRAYRTPLDIQRGLLVGFSYKKVDFTTHIFNFGWTDPTIVLALSYKF